MKEFTSKTAEKEYYEKEASEAEFLTWQSGPAKI